MSLRTYKHFIEEVIPGFGSWDPEEKQKNVELFVQMHLDRLQSMFKWSGLPDSIPQKYLETYLMCNGNCIIAQNPGDNELYALVGALSDMPDAYYLPTKYVVANPYLKLNKIYTIQPGEDQDAILIRNDTFMVGLLPLLKKYGSLLAENELSMNISVINSRIISLITADSDKDKASADKFLKDIKEGRLGSIGSSAFMEGVKTQPYATSSQGVSLTSMIEYEQYLKASLFNELGLNANYNMKRESINSNESQLNDDMLTPLIDDMLALRKEACEQINNLFGTDISVDFDSAWKENEVTTSLEMGVLENDDSGILPDSDADPMGSSDAGADETGEAEEVQPKPMGETEEEPSGEDEEPINEDLEEIKEDLEEIKEDLEEIKEGGEDDVPEA